MLEIKNLTGFRGERLLFKGLSFRVKQEEILLVEGKNGTGKTSLMRLLAALATPREGDILWQGASIEKLMPQYHRDISYVGHENGANLDLTVRETLEFHLALKANASGFSIEAAMEKLSIARYADVPLRFLSAGQRRRAALARLPLSKSQLWLLDEPFTALDDEAINVIVEMIEQHLDSCGMAIVTSHQHVDWRRSTVNALQLEGVS